MVRHWDDDLYDAGTYDAAVVEPTLADLRARVRELLDLSTNDPLFTDAIIDRQLNLAYRKVLRAQPNGWWWQHVEITVTTAAETALLPVQLPVPDDTRMISKAYAVFGSLDANYFLPIAQRERTDQVRLSGGGAANGLPLSWAVVADVGHDGAHRHQIALSFEPPLPAGASVRYIVVLGPADLTVEGSIAGGIPAVLVDALVEYANVALARQQRLGPSAAARRKYTTTLSLLMASAEERLHNARVAFDRPYEGAGSGPLHGSRL